MIAERDDQPARAPIAVDQHAPGTSPDRENRRGRGDSQPGDAEHPDMAEEQHRERGPEVVEHRADHEERVGRHAIGQVGVRRADEFGHALIMPAQLGMATAILW